MTDFFWVSCLSLQLSLSFRFCSEQFRYLQNVQAADGEPGYQRLHTTATVMVGMGTCNGSPVTYGGLPHWVVEIFNTSAFWQYFCLSY